jgi:hypothetical protein
LPIVTIALRARAAENLHAGLSGCGLAGHTLGQKVTSKTKCSNAQEKSFEAREIL